MGSWTVQSVTGTFDDLASPYGHNFYVTFKLKYAASVMGKFVEPPPMAWDEVILFNDYKKGQRWELNKNMYELKPASPTVAVWGQRYYRAYLAAKGQMPGGNIKGHAKLFDKNGLAVAGKALPDFGKGEYAKINDAVRDYLKKHGGGLEIKVHDIPGIGITDDPRDVERVLIFNCGVSGMGPRVKAWQHIRINGDVKSKDFQMNGNAPGLKTTGLTLDPTPYAAVPNPTPAEGAVKDF